MNMDMVEAKNQMMLSEFNDLLNEVELLLTEPKNTRFAMNELLNGLQAIKTAVSDSVWKMKIIPAARSHAVNSLVTQCPATRHSQSRPRGYPGDADLLDLIYKHPSTEYVRQQETFVGQAIFDMLSWLPACQAVRERLSLMAAKIDEIAAQQSGADILSLACGNLREAELSNALKLGQIGSFAALDQDELSLDTVASYRQQGIAVVNPQHITVKEILSRKHSLSQFDFIYSAGLYDYLQENIASRLTRKLFDLVKPGGTLLVANFLHGIWEAPYMEAYMDWHLIYRDKPQIESFASEISASDIASCTYYQDDAGCIGYLEIRRVK